MSLWNNAYVLAIRVTSPGGPEKLVAAHVELPDLGPDEVRVDVLHAGVNFWDVMQRRGSVPLPKSQIPGVEGAGHVRAIGPGVQGLVPGQLVAWSKVSGSYAQQVQGPHDWFVPVPERLTAEAAAAALMQGTTAWYLAHDVLPLQAGDSAVVFAAAGGVGQMLTQMLTSRGIHVLGVVGPVSSAPKVQVARDSGAIGVVIEGDTLLEDIRRYLPEGATAVFNANGGEQALHNLDMLGTRGTVVYYGTTSGPLPSLDLGRLSRGSLAVRRVRGADYLGSPGAWRNSAEKVLNHVADGRLRVRIDTRAGLAHVPILHERMESRANIGKLLIDVA